MFVTVQLKLSRSIVAAEPAISSHWPESYTMNGREKLPFCKNKKLQTLKNRNFQTVSRLQADVTDDQGSHSIL